MFRSKNRNLIIKIFLILTAILSIIYLYNYFDISEKISQENLEIYLKKFGYWLPFAYLGIFIGAMLLNLPCSVFLITAGTIFGPLWGTFWGIIGCVIASTLIFLMARKIGYKKVKEKFGDKWATFDKRVEENGFLYITLIRAVPVFSFAMISYASAVTSIKSGDYFKGTYIGCIPLVLIYADIVPLVLTKNLSIQNISYLSIILLSWGIFFWFLYKGHKKQELLKN